MNVPSPPSPRPKTSLQKSRGTWMAEKHPRVSPGKIGNRSPAEKKGRAAVVACHPAFGMWTNRQDPADVGRTVRNLRKGRGHAR